MGDVDQALTPTPKAYLYALAVPDVIAEAITAEVKELAAKDSAHRTFEAWAHELPVWTVTAHVGARANSVRAEVLWDLLVPQSLLCVSPDAYDDEPIEDSSFAGAVRRTVASADDVSQLTNCIPLVKLGGGKEAPGIIRGVLAATLERAAELILTEARVISYPSPYREVRRVT